MQPVVVLVHTQLAVNIGMCARAMLNCGLTELRLVAPRDGWPNDEAINPAKGAAEIIKNAKCFEDIDSALADCIDVLATSARGRELEIPTLNLPEAIDHIRDQALSGMSAILFGPEASGLSNDVLSRANHLVNYEMNPDYTSLNLAQAVLLFGWEWWSKQPKPKAEPTLQAPAKRHQLEHFLTRLTQELEDVNFFPTADKKPTTVRQLNTFFTRAQPTERELKSLQGMLTALRKKR